MIEAVVAIGFLLNNIAWMVFLYLFIPERKVKQIKMPKMNISALIPGQTVKRPDVTIPVEQADPREILKSMRGDK